ncbi:MAG TPA: hypothetical protein PKW05_00665 [Anaerolineae bacterium]|nr:hypothetical protein [Anaerolineae bacterium]HQJ50280.1 hypothetical protein [Anaerolineae bacterium]
MKGRIEADHVQIGTGVTLGTGSSVHAQQVLLGDNVVIGEGVEIVCDRLELKADCQVGAGSFILCPEVVAEQGCFFGRGFKAELNQSLRLGRFCVLGPDTSLAGQSVQLEEFVFLDEGVAVGGGGSKGPRASLFIGGRTSLFARTFVNLSEPVTIGRNVGISFNVALLTHNAWQPVLRGYKAQFAPVTIQDNATIYFNVVVLPGVTIGEWSTIGAGSVVVKDVPAHCLAVGNPAQVVRGPLGYPRPLQPDEQDALVHSILADYLTSLALKGVNVVEDSLAADGTALLEFGGRRVTLSCLRRGASVPAGNAPADITLAIGPVPPESQGRCHFDLLAETVSGPSMPLAEDLRDFLRRRGIRIFSDRPFQSLPLLNLQRLQQRRASGRLEGGQAH